MDGKGAKREGRFVKLSVEPDGAIFAHRAIQAGVEKRFDIDIGREAAQVLSGLLKTGFRAHARGGMDALVIHGLDPLGELVVKFIQAGGLLVRQKQGGLEAGLNRLDQAFDFSLAPGMIGFGVQKPDTKTGADNAGMMTDEGLALIGVKHLG